MYLFVYGTLKRGQHNHRVLGDAEYIGKFRIPNLEMYSMGGFPGVVQGSGEVLGELYKIKPEQLPRLDALEGYNENWPEDHCMYLRKPYRIITEVGTWDYFIYIWNGRIDGRPKIESGVWE